MACRRITGQGFRYSRINSWQVGQNMELFERHLRSLKVGEGSGGAAGSAGSPPDAAGEEKLLGQQEDSCLKEVLPTVFRREARGRNSKLCYQGRGKVGPFSQLDKKAMVLHRKRRLRLTTHQRGGYLEHDLRFRLWHEEPQLQERLVLLALMDASGSMEEDAKQIARLFYWHLLATMEQIYWQVEPVFIIHHTGAEEVSRGRFFSRSSGGGTKFSPAYRLAWEIIATRYDQSLYPVAVFHLSDGYNIPGDRRECQSWLVKLCQVCRLVCYGEVGRKQENLKTYLDSFKELSQPGLMHFSIEDKTQVSPMLSTLLPQILAQMERN